MLMPTNDTSVDYPTLITATVCSSITVVFSSLFIFYVIFQTVRKRLFFRYMSLRILTYIELCALFASITDIYVLGNITTPIPRALCIIEAIQTQLFEISGAMWTLCLSTFIITTLTTTMRRKIM